jgi:S-adenosylmethionine hydrolase
MSRRIITLLTDFGMADPYVATMKGAALAVNPDAQLVDISHEIAPQDIADAGYVLAFSYRYFPVGTVHVAVVDPGVGGERRILAAEVEGHLLIAPDNGLLSAVLLERPASRLVHVEKSVFFRHPVSATFHGRDIFAPVAAHLSLGVDLDQMGPRTTRYVQLEAASARTVGDALDGRVIHVDRFGNLVTNISSEQIAAMEGTGWPHVRVGEAHIGPVRRTYAEAAIGEPLAVIGSSELLEISVNCGSAAGQLGVGRGTPVRVARSRL